MLSLARAYVCRYVETEGARNSGIHILWLTKQRIGELPELKVGDLLHSSSLPLSRQVELARWSIIMLRLTFISDLAIHAAGSGHPIADLSNLVDDAAPAVNTFNSRRLLGWTRRVALNELDRALPRSQYTELARALHQFDGSPHWQQASGLSPVS